MPKFGVSIYSISRKITSGEITPEQGIKWLAEQGAETIEIVPFGIDLLSDEKLAERMLQEANNCGVTIDNYSLNANFLMLTDEEYEAEVLRVKAHIDAAKDLGIKTFRVDSSSYRRPIEKNTIENFQEEQPVIVKTYTDLCDYAAKYNIKVLLENHGFHVNGSDRVRQIITSIKHDNFGYQLDVGNFVCVDDIAEISVKKLIQFATTVHMKDFYIRPSDRDPGDATQFDCSGSWFRTVNGRFLRGSILAQGDLDMIDIIRTIKASGFDGNIYIEYEGMEDCYYGTKVSLDNLKRIYNSIN